MWSRHSFPSRSRTRARRFLAAFCFLGAVAAPLFAPAPAASGIAGGNPSGLLREAGIVRFWTGAGDGASWSDPANWQPEGEPTGEDTVFVQAAVPDTIIPIRGSIGVLVDGDGAAARLTIHSGPASVSVRVLPGATLEVGLGGSNDGLLLIDELAALSLLEGALFTNLPGGEIHLLGGDIVGDGTLVNGGLVLKLDPDSKSRAISSVGGRFENAVDDPGDGAIVVGEGVLAIEGEFTNEGSVRLEEGSAMMLDPADGPLRVAADPVNGGEIVVEEGAILEIAGGDALVNDAGGLVRLLGGDVVGDGTFRNHGEVRKEDPEDAFTSTASIVSASFENRSDDPGEGAVRVAAGSLQIEDAFENSGSIVLDASTEAVFDPADGPVEGAPLMSDGRIEVGESAFFRFPDAVNGLKNLEAGAIVLAGGTLEGIALLENYGVIRAEQPEAFRSARSAINMPGENRADDPGDGALREFDGRIRVEDGAVLAIEADLGNGGEITVASGGELSVEATAKDAAPVLVNDGSVVVAPGGALTDKSEVSVGLGGVVRIGGTATVEPGASWTQHGLTVVEGTGRLAIETDGRAVGLFDNEGTLDLEAGALVDNHGNFIHQENGILAGVGTFDNAAGSFLADGIFKPGKPVGVLAFVGDLVLGPVSEVWVHLRGTVAGDEYDKLLVDGEVSIGGALKVGMLDFQPEVGDRFDVIEGTGGALRFTSIDCFGGLDLPGGLYLEPIEETNALALVTVDSIAGNAPPEAGFDVGSTDAEVPVVLELLQNDFDADGDPLRIVGVGTGLAAGFVEIDEGDSSVTYTPAGGFAGADAFSYAVTDCEGGLDSAVVTVHVSSDPRAWYVPGDAPTIAAGLDSAFAGDTVIVACGEYDEHDLAMKSGVVLKSETGLAGCVTIDAGGAGRGILCDAVDPGTVIEGFTIAAGAADRGAGLLCVNGARPELRRVALVGGAATAEGGGCASDESSRPVFRQATFAGSRAGGLGGGLFLEGEATLDRVVLWGNDAAGGEEAYVEAFGVAPFDASDVDSSGVAGPGSATYLGGTIFADPLYCDALDPADAPTADGDYRLDLDSPCFATPPSAARGAYGVGCLGNFILELEWFGEDPPPYEAETAVEAAGAAAITPRFDVHPNPSAGSVTIAFARPAGASGEVRVYDVAGRLVRAYPLASNAGSIAWDGTNASGARVAPGVYFVRLSDGAASETKRVTLIR